MDSAAIVSSNSTLIYDTAYTGGVDSQGQIVQLWGPSALDNAIILWLTSFRSDIIRDPNRGGYFTRWIFKPMNVKNIDAMMMSIRDGIDQDFIPQLTLLALNITPNFPKRYWEVFMQVFAKSLQIGTTLNVNIRNQV